MSDGFPPVQVTVIGCPQGTSEPETGDVIVNPDCATTAVATEALETVAPPRGVIARMDTIKAASSAAERMLFLYMGVLLVKAVNEDGIDTHLPNQGMIELHFGGVGLCAVVLGFLSTWNSD